MRDMTPLIGFSLPKTTLNLVHRISHCQEDAVASVPTGDNAAIQE